MCRYAHAAWHRCGRRRNEFVVVCEEADLVGNVLGGDFLFGEGQVGMIIRLGSGLTGMSIGRLRGVFCARSLVQHHQIINDDCCSKLLLSVRSFVVAGFQSAFRVDTTSFHEIFSCNFSELAPGDDGVKLRLFMALSFVVGIGAVGGNTKITHRFAGFGGPKNRIAGYLPSKITLLILRTISNWSS